MKSILLFLTVMGFSTLVAAAGPSTSPSKASPAKPTRFKGAVGLGMGGNVAPLISDQSTGLLGGGAGNQYSFYVSAFRNKPVGLKLRMDWMKFRQKAVLNTKTDYYYPATRYKESEQNYRVWSLNAEKIFAGKSQIFYWELGLGYAFGGGGTFTITQNTPDGGTAAFPHSLASSWALTGGIGMRKNIIKSLTATADARTMALLHTAYNEGPISNKFLWPAPLMLTFHLEWEFDF